MTKITVPSNNDNLINVTLDEENYKLKVSYNGEGEYWSLGVYTDSGSPIVSQMKLIPCFPINRYFCRNDMPQGIFCVDTTLDRLEKDSFSTGKASLYFLPYSEIPTKGLKYAM